jgi:hypothetical protein
LYADSITEEQKRLGYARVLVEIDVESECPKEIVICRANGDLINIGVEYPWLPPKCSLCGGFGHAVYACSKKETKKWVPKTYIQAPGKQKSLGAIQKPRGVSSHQTDPGGSGVNTRKSPGAVQTPSKIMKPISRPSATKVPSGKAKTLGLSNSFAHIGLEDTNEEEFTLRSPVNVLDVFEKALSSKDRGKAKVGEDEVRGFSPTPGI